jgi:transcriptional regulator with XRE-family HTH domain
VSDAARPTIESSLSECEAHLDRLRHGAKVLADVFPLSEERLSALNDEKLAHLDQFIYRFTKLQDSMARRLLPSLYTWLENDPSPRPFIDILNRLEQLGVLTDVASWQRFRNLRNNLAHDYPGRRDQTVATLNELFDTWQELEAMFATAREEFERRVS